VSSAVNWLDAILILLLAISVARSFAKGLTREVVGLLSVLIGILAACWFYAPAAAFIEPHVSSRAVAAFCGFLAVFTGVLLLGSLTGYLLARLLRITGLSFFDRLLGAVFGIVRGVLLASTLVMAILAFAPGARADTPPAVVAHSRLAPYVVGAARLFVAAAPREMKDGFKRSYEQVKSEWETTIRKEMKKLPREARHEREI
jgi:membrane protein required for colicin V production